MNNAYSNNSNPGDNIGIPSIQPYPPQNAYNNMGKSSGSMDMNNNNNNNDNNNSDISNAIIPPMNKRMKMYDKDNMSESYTDMDNKGFFFYFFIFFYFFYFYFFFIFEYVIFIY